MDSAWFRGGGEAKVFGFALGHLIQYTEGGCCDAVMFGDIVDAKDVLPSKAEFSRPDIDSHSCP